MPVESAAASAARVGAPLTGPVFGECAEHSTRKISPYLINAFNHAAPSYQFI